MTETRSPTSPQPASDLEVEVLRGFHHRHADVNGARIHYVIGGDGPAVVLVHGYPYTWATWRKLMPLLVAAGYTVVAPDLRGLGDSSKTEAGYDKRNVAEDVRAVVRREGLRSIRLVGSDIGTMVAYAYAAAHPEEIERLVLAESVLPGFGLEELMNPATGGFWHFGFHMQVDVATMLTAGKEDAYLLPMLTMMSQSKDAAQTAARDFLPYYRAPGGMRAGFQHYATLLHDGQENRASFRAKLTMPVLVLSGERGIPQELTLGSVAQVAERPAADIVPGAGHTFAEDNPTWTAERLTRFFEVRT